MVLAHSALNHVYLVSHLCGVTLRDQDDLTELTQNVSLIGCADRCIVIMSLVKLEVSVLL